MFKENFQLEYYLTAVATVKYRIALTKIRVSCHRLAIETGWYQKPTSLPINQRLCTLCNQVEDEIHLVCIFKRNAHLKMEYFGFLQSIHPLFQFMPPKEKVIYYIMQNKDLFQFMPPKEKVTYYIMQNKDYNVINHLAAFIYRSLLLVS